MVKDSKIKTPPEKPDLRSFVDLELEAEKFELDPVRVEEIADEIVEDSSTTISFSVTQRESELRDRLKVIYDQEVTRLSECQYPGCDHRFVDVYDFLAHHRIHLINGPDPKVTVAVIRDIERLLIPVVEKSATLEGALPQEERQRILEALRERKMLIKH